MTLVPAVQEVTLESMALQDQKVAVVTRGHLARRVLLDWRVLLEALVLLVQLVRVDLKELRAHSDHRDCKDHQVCHVIIIIIIVKNFCITL